MPQNKRYKGPACGIVLPISFTGKVIYRCQESYGLSYGAIHASMNPSQPTASIASVMERLSCLQYLEHV